MPYIVCSLLKPSCPYRALFDNAERNRHPYQRDRWVHQSMTGKPGRLTRRLSLRPEYPELMHPRSQNARVQADTKHSRGSSISTQKLVARIGSGSLLFVEYAPKMHSKITLCGRLGACVESGLWQKGIGISRSKVSF